MSQTVNIGAYAARFRGRLAVFKRGVLIKLFGAVIKDTPVLTGRLRANWQFSTTAPIPVALNTVDPSGGATTNTMSAGVQAEVTEKDGNYYLTNNMPYVGRIEYEGWSHTKAPAGMVRKNMVRIANILRQQAGQTST